MGHIGKIGLAHTRSGAESRREPHLIISWVRLVVKKEKGAVGEKAPPNPDRSRNTSSIRPLPLLWRFGGEANLHRESSGLCGALSSNACTPADV